MAAETYRAIDIDFELIDLTARTQFCVSAMPGPSTAAPI
jgi:hypothetical protein